MQESNMSQTSYQSEIESLASLRDQHGSSWSGINPEFATRMKLQNRFHTGLDIARYTAAIMRQDMADYDGDSSRYTQSLGCWHGFIGQQKMIAIKKHHSTTSKRYLYLSGWMVAGMRSKFGTLPDQSMHEKKTVPELI
ncbi:MAG: isocitrate lyase, partial [Actinomycetota bacterium]